MLSAQYDAFAPQPENVTKDVQERAERVGNAVNNTLSGRVGADDAERAIQNEEIRSFVTSMAYSEDDFRAHVKYRKYLKEALDVISEINVKQIGNQTNSAKINQTNVTREYAQMNVAKQRLY
jgi:hypothetical protein